MKRFWIAPITILLVSGILVGCQGIPPLQRLQTPVATGEAAAQDGTAAATADASGAADASTDQAAASAQQEAAPQDSGTAQGDTPAYRQPRRRRC